jgi:hypothetical protein
MIKIVIKITRLTASSRFHQSLNEEIEEGKVLLFHHTAELK